MALKLRGFWMPTQAEFNAFAAVSGDDNPIHVDAAFAARTGFGRTVSHGMLIYAKLWELLRHHRPQARQAGQTMMFPNPCFAGEEVELRIDERDAGVLDMRALRRADLAELLVGQARIADIPAPLAVGARACLTRRFTQADRAAFEQLAGGTAQPGVPEPLLAGLVSHLLGVHLPGAGTNYLKQDLVFAAPAPWNQEITASVEVTRLRPQQQLVDLWARCTLHDGRVICEGRALVKAAM